MRAFFNVDEVVCGWFAGDCFEVFWLMAGISFVNGQWCAVDTMVADAKGSSIISRNAGAIGVYIYNIRCEN